MSDDLSKLRSVRNEQLLRAKNMAASKSIKRYFRNKKEVAESPIAFICECSQLDCNEHVTLPIDLYERLHQRKDRFTISRGHDIPAIERVVAHEDDFVIVEKFVLQR
jgi:hypothetical protein